MTSPETNNSRDLSALVSVGLLSESSAPQNASGVPQVVYALTDKGRKTIFSAANPIRQGALPLFCFGKIRVDKILNFTVPVPENGVMISHVQYTVRLEDIPSWAKEPAILAAFPNMTEAAFQRGGPRDEVLGLTNLGWRVARDR